MILRTLLAAVSIASLGVPSLAASYDIDPVHSSVNFRIRHMRVSLVVGRFNEFSGSLSFDASDPAACSVEMAVRTASVDTGNSKRDAHLRTSDFFDAEEHPEVTFRSTAWKQTGDRTYDVTGDLSLHGTTRTVTAAVEYLGAGPGGKGRNLAGFLARLDIRRSEFGMTNMVGPVGDEVELTIAVEAHERETAPESWDVVLTDIAKNRKIMVIALVRKVTGMSLKQTAEHVDCLEFGPVVVRQSLSAEDADALVEQIAQASGTAKKVPGAGPPRPLAEPEVPPFPIQAGPVDVVLRSVYNQIGVVKELRAITGLGLADVQALLGNLPALVKTAADLEEARALKARLEKAGGGVHLRPAR